MNVVERAAPPSWRRNQIVITAVSFVGFTGFTLVMPFLPLYIQQLGVKDIGEVAMWSGVSLGITPALTALLSPAWGRVADRFGRKLMVERSLLSFVVVMAAMAFATRPWHVLALRAVQGLFAGYGALTLAMAAEIAPREKLASSIGIVQTAQRLGPAVGPVIGGAIAAVVGLRQAFLVTACFYVAAVLLTFFGYHEPSAVRAAVHPPRPARPTFKAILRYENFVLLTGGIFGLQLVDRSFGPILPLHVAAIGIPEGRVALVSGLLFSGMACTAALGHHLAGRFLRRHPARRVIVGAIGVAGAGIAICLAPASIVVLSLGLAICGVGVGAATTAAYTAAGLVIPAGVHGSAFGVLSASSLAGLALSPVISGFLGAFHIRLVFLLDLAVLLVLAIVVRRLMVTPATAGTGERAKPAATFRATAAADD